MNVARSIDRPERPVGLAKPMGNAEARNRWRILLGAAAFFICVKLALIFLPLNALGLPRVGDDALYYLWKAELFLRGYDTQAPGSRHLPSRRLPAPNGPLAGSRARRLAQRRPSICATRPRFRPMLNCATVAGAWEQSSG